MVATNGSIIASDGRTTRDARSQEQSSQDIAAMAVALQWHLATNTSDSVALATSRNAETGIGQKDVVIVMCDAVQGEAHDTRLAAGLARDIFDTFADMTSVASAHASDRVELAQRLSEAIVHSLKRAPAGQPVAAGANSPADTPAAIRYSAVVTVIHNSQLFVARYGDGDVFLLRAGQLLHLTDSSFTTTHTNAYDPDLGQLELAGEDRVLLCSDAFSVTLKEGQIKSVLRATPSSRKAASNLLDLAERANVTKPLALAVVDYVSGQTGVFPAAPAAPATAAPVAGTRRGTFRTIAASLGLILLVAFAAWAFSTFATGNSGVPVAPGTQSTQTAPTPGGTLVPAIVITATETVAPSPSPSPTATSTPEPTATLEPTNTPTVAPTDTPEPTETPVPTRRPTRRPPTATPEPPTATPEPPTATPEPTLVPTDTPVPPPPPSNGGGGGGQSEPPPPCPPGATCG